MHYNVEHGAIEVLAAGMSSRLGRPWQLLIYHKSFFAQLTKLKGDTGARKILVQRTDNVSAILFARGNRYRYGSRI